MPLFGQFFLGVVGCVKAEALGADNSHAQIIAFQNCVITFAVRAVFLRTDVVFVQTVDSVGEDAVIGSMTLVNVVLNGAQTVVGDILQLIRQEHTENTEEMIPSETELQTEINTETEQSENTTL